MPCLRLAQSGGHENNLSEPIAREDNLRCRGWGLTSILPRQGEVAGPSQTEGEERETQVPCPPPPPPPATPTLAAEDRRIEHRGVRTCERANVRTCEPYEEEKPNLPPSLEGRGWGWVGFRISAREWLKRADPPPTPPLQGGENARQRIPLARDHP